jgi:hypothetical protein
MGLIQNRENNKVFITSDDVNNINNINVLTETGVISNNSLDINKKLPETPSIQNNTLPCVDPNKESAEMPQEFHDMIEDPLTGLGQFT